MRNDWTSKLSASFIALAVVLSALVFIPAVGQGQTASTANIYVPVTSDGSPVTDAKVNLTDVHTGSVIAAQFDWDRSAYVASNAPAGYYVVDVTHDEHYDQLECADFRFNATKNHTLIPVDLEAFPSKVWTWNVSVKRHDGIKATGAIVGFYDPTSGKFGEFVERGVTNQANGSVELDMFTTGSIDLVVIHKDYQTYISTVAVSGDNSLTITLSLPNKVSSYLTDSSGSPAFNAVSYLINKDDSVPWVKRVLRSTGSAMSFNAYPGNFVLVIDARGCQAKVMNVTVPGLLPPSAIQLGDQTQRTEDVSIEYGDDFRAFDLTVDAVWSYDTAYPGLRYNDMGSLRMQIDLVRGDGDGDLSADEADNFRNEVFSYGAQYVSSASLLVVNDTSYLSADATTGFVLDLAPGAVTSTDSVHYTYSCAYAADSIDVDAQDYTAIAYARPDTPSVDYKYSIGLVNGYELVSNSSTDNVEVTGYLTVMIDHVSGSAVEAVGMAFEKSDLPTPKAEVESEDTEYVYVVEDDGGNVTGYIVRVGRNVTFLAGDSTDPNGNPLTFTWNFGDGAGNFTTTNASYVYNYSTAADLRVVTLVVTDVAGLTNTTEINVTCDGMLPVPVMLVKNQTVDLANNSITIDQRDTVVFNATNSTDDVTVAGDGLGVIAFFEFEYGDGNRSGRISWDEADKNVTHAYASAGNYTVVLNVTDVVGQWKNTTMLVNVNDTETPLVSFLAKNEDWGSSLTENKTVIFDANATTDNKDNITLLLFSWDFGDGTWLNGTGAEGYSNVTHVYSRIGQIQVVLNVTDTEGNYKPSSKVINIAQGPRPNMRILNATFQPSPMTEDKTGHLIINMTNSGSANATGVVVYVYKVNADGTLELLGQTSELINTTTGASVTMVEIGGTVRVEYPVSFKSKGTYTLRINVTSTDQLRATSHVMSGDTAVVVEEAGWKRIALWGGVIGVIVLVPLAILLMRRRSGRERGPRREKKSRAEEEK